MEVGLKLYALRTPMEMLKASHRFDRKGLKASLQRFAGFGWSDGFSRFVGGSNLLPLI